MPIRVVTISHTTGAGGETIGRTVADRLGFRYIDEEIITLAAEKEGVDPELVADTERRKGFLSRLFSGLTEGPVDVGVPGAGVQHPSTGWQALRGAFDEAIGSNDPADHEKLLAVAVREASREALEDQGITAAAAKEKLDQAKTIAKTTVRRATRAAKEKIGG